MTIAFRPGLIWGFDFTDGHPEAIEPGDAPLAATGDGGAFRWLHLNLADQWTRRWIEASPLPGGVRDLLLGGDAHQRMLIADGAVAGLVHDFERDFAPEAVARIGSMAFVLAPGLIISARQHPLCAADIIYERIRSGVAPASPAAALDLLVSAVLEVASGQLDELTGIVQASEDALLERNRAPDNRALFAVRRRAVLLRRQLGGMRGLLGRMERDDDLPELLLPVIERLAQRAASLDGDVAMLDSNLRQLREEVDIQTATRTNQNLFILSILTALLLPATLVTGFFGMNTDGMPLEHGGGGTWVALLIAVMASLAVYLWLSRRGFFRD